jgi:hypothetical protein
MEREDQEREIKPKQFRFKFTPDEVTEILLKHVTEHFHLDVDISVDARGVFGNIDNSKLKEEYRHVTLWVEEKI